MAADEASEDEASEEDSYPDTAVGILLNNVKQRTRRHPKTYKMLYAVLSMTRMHKGYGKRISVTGLTITRTGSRA